MAMIGSDDRPLVPMIAPEKGGMSKKDKEKARELQRKRYRDSLRKVELPDEILEGIDGSMQHKRKNYKAHNLYPLNDLDAEKLRKEGSAESVETDVEVIDPMDAQYDAEIKEIAKRTPEVRVSQIRMVRPFSDDELKIIAAALRTNQPIYRVSDALHCSTHKVLNAIESVPVLKQLKEEGRMRRREEAQEAVDDCIKARVPSVVMWNAEHLLPEIYGNQVNLDNEDDTKLVIGAIPEDMVAAAEAQVASASASIPTESPNAVMEVLEAERQAEIVAGGGGIPPNAPLSALPPAPALNPPPDDPRFTKFVPAAEMVHVNADDIGPDNYGDVGGGGMDDFGADDDGSWI